MRCGRLARMKPDHTANAQLLVIALGIDAAHRLLAMRGRGAGRAIRARARVIADRRGPAERVIAARRRPSPTVRVIAVGTGSHWGRLRRIGVGNLPAPIPGSLPQCPFPAPLRHSNALFPAPLRLFPHRKVAPALGSGPMPVPVRSLDTGAGCGGATVSIFAAIPLLVRRNHLAHERPSPGGAHGEPVFTAIPTRQSPFSQRYHTCAAIQHFASVITLAK